MPLELPNGWRSLPAPSGLGLIDKWEACRDARLPVRLFADEPEDAVRIAADQITYEREEGQRDNWQQPAITLGRHKGDCEDIALFQRALLINGGMAAEDIWLLICYDLIAKQDHALLWLPTCYLDHRARRPLKHSNFQDYRPIIAFCEAEVVSFGRSR